MKKNCLFRNTMLKRPKQIVLQPFTLIELLVVAAILAILISLFTPAMRSAMYRAKNLKCVTNLKNLTIVTSTYCDDFNDYYPARIRPGRGLVTGRFFSRENDSGYRLGSILSGYIDPSSPTWTCAQYTPNNHSFNGFIDLNGSRTRISCNIGGERGCSDHGITHLDRNNMSYNFYGGVDPHRLSNSGETWVPKKSRLRLGEPLVHTDRNAVEYNSTIMWSDVFSIKDDAGRNQRYGHPRFYNYLSLHKPPPSSNWAHWYDGYWGSKEEEGLLSIHGAAVSNWSFEDGAVKSIELPLGGYRRQGPVKEYFYIRYGINAQTLIPIE